jgi:hypothetical protein
MRDNFFHQTLHHSSMPPNAEQKSRDAQLLRPAGEPQANAMSVVG